MKKLILIIFILSILQTNSSFADVSCVEKKVLQCTEVIAEAKNVNSEKDNPELKQKKNKAKEKTKRKGDKRPDDQFNFDLFGRKLTIGGEYDARLIHEEDFSLSSREKDDATMFRQELELEFLYKYSKNIYAFLEGKIIADKDLYREDGDEEFESALERGEMWVYFSSLADSNFDLQIGRQNFEDEREWWWDEDLDSIRLHFEKDKLQASIAIAEELDRVSTRNGEDPENKDLQRLIGQLDWEWSKRHHLSFYYLNHDDQSGNPAEGRVFERRDQDEVDSELEWWGIDTRGRIKTDDIGRFYYWTNLAFVDGDESVVDFDNFGTTGLRVVDEIEKQDVRGWGVDLGVTWKTKLMLPLSFTLGYATTSSDSDFTDNDDKTFRQTGLQGNTDRFRGVDTFRYYGELLRPELSNLSIFTASVGMPILKNSSVELVYHHYEQVEKADFLRDVDIEADPNGRNKDIGDEIDLIFGIEEWKHIELELIGSIFEPGSAFDSSNDDTAYKVEFKFNYNF